MSKTGGFFAINSVTIIALSIVIPLFPDPLIEQVKALYGEDNEGAFYLGLTGAIIGCGMGIAAKLSQLIWGDFWFGLKFFLYPATGVFYLAMFGIWLFE